MDSLQLNKIYNNKNIEKILIRPPLSTIKMKELLSAMSALGFNVENIVGSHYKFSHPLCPEVIIPAIPRPHGGKNEVKRGYIRIIQNAIIEINERKNNILWKRTVDIHFLSK